MNIEKIIEVNEDLCLESYPCKHYVKVQLKNGEIKNIMMNGKEIYELSLKHNYSFLNFRHFSGYSKYCIEEQKNNNFKALLQFGTYYNPAYLHYPNNISKHVMCDACDKITNVAIGYESCDLCLSCVDKMTK